MANAIRSDLSVPETIQKWAGVLWFLTALGGQLAFIYFIVVYYGGRTISGDYPGWNDKPLIDGYVAGDPTGNVMFITHVFGAAAITLAGLVQLIPAVRAAAPAFHRWNGRLFMTIAFSMSLGGIWLGWGRGTQLSTVSAVAISMNGVLIMVFAVVALRYAMRREIDSHRRWAMRLFMAVNGVWFLRVGLMAWMIMNQGPVGMSRNLDGPADIFLVFGCYLIPLAVLEVYFRAQDGESTGPKLGAAALTIAMTVIMAIGVFGTITMMWGPYL